MNSLWYGTTGSPDSRIVVVGESWGQEELFAQQPFVGPSGQELDRMLAEAGLHRDAVMCTNVVNKKPPRNELERLMLPSTAKAPLYRGLNPTSEIHIELARLYQQLEAFPRDVIIVAGNWSLWALTDCCGTGTKSLGDYTVKVPTGIVSWRGSQIYSDCLRTKTRVLPIIHPAAILREWKWRTTTVQDLRRVHNADDWWPREAPSVFIPSSPAEAIGALSDLYAHLQTSATPIRIANDIETWRNQITCIGFGYGPYISTPGDKHSALVIPLIRAEGAANAREYASWWEPGVEARILRLIRIILTHPNILLEGQNYLYDTQFFIRWLGIRPRLDFDTMLAQHLLFPGTPKGLDFLSSLYCHYHRYWKEDGKEWDVEGNQEKNLLYNGEDCLRTYECATVLRSLISHFHLEEQWQWEKRKADLALRMMLKGIRIDMEHRTKLRREISAEQRRIHERLSRFIPSWIVPTPKSSKKSWWESEHQQKALFYDVLGLTGQFHRKTKKPTINDEALNVLTEEYPELGTIFEHLKAERSLGVFRSNFLDAEVDADGRMRSSFNIAGTETFRWSSSANVFGSGTNLQNIPSGDEE